MVSSRIAVYRDAYHKPQTSIRLDVCGFFRSYRDTANISAKQIPGGKKKRKKNGAQDGRSLHFERRRAEKPSGFSTAIILMLVLVIVVLW